MFRDMYMNCCVVHYACPNTLRALGYSGYVSFKSLIMALCIYQIVLTKSKNLLFHLIVQPLKM